MSDEPTDRDEATQETPKGHTIPIPSKADVLRDLRKVAKPKKGSGAGSPKQER